MRAEAQSAAAGAAERDQRRRRVASVVATLATAGLIPVLLRAGLRLDAQRWLLLLTFGAVAGVAFANDASVARYVSEGTLVDRVRLDAGGVLVVLALAFTGPLAAFAIEGVPELMGRFAGRPRTSRLAQWSNIASFGWGALAAAAVLAGLGHPAGQLDDSVSAISAFALAGITYFVVNYAVTRGIVAVLAGGQPLVATVRRELVPTLPADVAMVLAATGSVALSIAVGPAGMVPLVLAVAAPRITMIVLAKLAVPARTLPVRELRLHYAEALADQLAISSGERQLLRGLADLDRGDQLVDGAIRFESVPSPAARGGMPAPEQWPRFADLLLSINERYDGHGWPGARAAERIPLEVRIVQVANRWAELTGCEAQLSHADALAHLIAAAGHELDPPIVQAVEDILASEPIHTRGIAVPVVHRLPHPQQVSRGALARVVSAFT